MRLAPAAAILALALAASAAAQTRSHLVRPGETMESLVTRYGVSAPEIQSANQLTSSHLPPGALLRIPVSSQPPVRPATAIPMARPVPVADPTPPPVAAPPPVVRPVTRVADPVPRETQETRPTEPETPSSSTSFAAAIRQPTGTRYNGRWTPPGESKAWVMDCSNTARWLQREVRGVDLPRTASDQYEYLRQRRQLWRVGTDPRKLRKKLQPGDLLFWENTYKPVRKPAITHVMTYLGTDSSGQMKMAGSQGSKGVNVYTFSPERKMGGYRAFLFFRRDGKFVAYGRP